MAHRRSLSIEDVFENNREVMESFCINSLEELIKSLGDRYDDQVRIPLLRMLPPKDRLFVREYYYVLERC